MNTTANASFGSPNDKVWDAVCELRSEGAVIGSAADRRFIPLGDTARRSLPLNGGAGLPGGGVVSLWCLSQGDVAETVDRAQLMIMKVGGFS